MIHYPPEDFLLQNRFAKILHAEYARKMPIYDYHTHLPVKEIHENRPFENIARLWLDGDHYKWRAMRTMGVDEALITGQFPDRDRFRAWAGTVPFTMGNPLFLWTHMELKRFFGISDLQLSATTADSIFDRCNEQLEEGGLTPREVLRQMSVKALCTTDDPLDDLSHHKALREDSTFSISILPTFRPDRALVIADSTAFNQWLDRMENQTAMNIDQLDDLLAALESRIAYFHDCGCRLADHSLEIRTGPEAVYHRADRVFEKVRAGGQPTPDEARTFGQVMIGELGRMYAAKEWAWQLHLGALRNINTRGFERSGPDSGFDTMGDCSSAYSLSRLLDDLDRNRQLPRTILYPLNPGDNEVIAAMIGCFQSDSVPGKMQLGPAWWFNDHKHGIERHLRVLLGIGFVSRFVGMVTDSRSFLSFSRHDYFRRILCSFFGNGIESGEMPEDTPAIGSIIQDICFHNAEEYFNLM